MAHGEILDRLLVITQQSVKNVYSFCNNCHGELAVTLKITARFLECQYSLENLWVHTTILGEKEASMVYNESQEAHSPIEDTQKT